MKKQSKRKTRSFKSSILLLLLMAVLLISSTYAWFTANQTVTVSSIQVNVQASNGLQISTDGSNWKSIISNADLTTNIASTYASNKNQVPEVLAPVSTDGSVTNGDLNMYYAEVDSSTGEYLLISRKQTDGVDDDTTNEVKRYYIVFDLFLKVEQSTKIDITSLSQVEKVGANDLGLQNAARIAFINEGNTTSGDTVANIQAQKSGTTSSIWEPNYDTHTTAGAMNGQNNYQHLADAFTAVRQDPDDESSAITGYTSAQLPYYGLKANSSVDNAVKLQQKTTPAATYFGAVTTKYATTNGFEDNFTFETLAKGVTKYRVYMWIEGQDIDCENGASGSDIKFNLQFTQHTDAEA